MLVMP